MRAVILLDRKRLVNGRLLGVRVNGRSPQVGEGVRVVLGDDEHVTGRVARVRFVGGMVYDVVLDVSRQGLAASSQRPSVRPSTSSGQAAEQGRLV